MSTADATFASESRETMDMQCGEVGAVSTRWTSTVGKDLLLPASPSILSITCSNFLKELLRSFLCLLSLLSLTSISSLT